MLSWVGHGASLLGAYNEQRPAEYNNLRIQMRLGMQHQCCMYDHVRRYWYYYCLYSCTCQAESSTLHQCSTGVVEARRYFCMDGPSHTNQQDQAASCGCSPNCLRCPQVSSPQQLDAAVHAVLPRQRAALHARLPRCPAHCSLIQQCTQACTAASSAARVSCEWWGSGAHNSLLQTHSRGTPFH